eukprot:2010548-Amphidinium_carterae.1
MHWHRKSNDSKRHKGNLERTRHQRSWQAWSQSSKILNLKPSYGRSNRHPRDFTPCSRGWKDAPKKSKSWESRQQDLRKQAQALEAELDAALAKVRADFVARRRELDREIAETEQQK